MKKIYDLGFKNSWEVVLFIFMNLCASPFTWLVLGVLLNKYFALGSIAMFFILFFLWKKIFKPDAKLVFKPRIKLTY